METSGSTKSIIEMCFSPINPITQVLEYYYNQRKKN